MNYIFPIEVRLDIVRIKSAWESLIFQFNSLLRLIKIAASNSSNEDIETNLTDRVMSLYKKLQELKIKKAKTFWNTQTIVQRDLEKFPAFIKDGESDPLKIIKAIDEASNLNRDEFDLIENTVLALLNQD